MLSSSFACLQGGNVEVFQRVNELKRLLDAGEEVDLSPEAQMLDEGECDEETERLVTRLRADMIAEATPIA